MPNIFRFYPQMLVFKGLDFILMAFYLFRVLYNFHRFVLAGNTKYAIRQILICLVLLSGKTGTRIPRSICVDFKFDWANYSCCRSNCRRILSGITWLVSWLKNSSIFDNLSANLKTTSKSLVSVFCILAKFCELYLSLRSW